MFRKLCRRPKIIKIIVGQFVISDFALLSWGELHWKILRIIIRVQNILGYCLPCDSARLVTFCASIERPPIRRTIAALVKEDEEHWAFGAKKSLSWRGSVLPGMRGWSRGRRLRPPVQRLVVSPTCCSWRLRSGLICFRW